MTRSCLAIALVALGLAGCPAVYPELGTRTPQRPPQAGRWIPLRPPSCAGSSSSRRGCQSAPADGRTWQANGKASPYAKLLLNGAELLRTSPESDTLAPTWPGSKHGNFKVSPGDRLRVELWDEKHHQRQAIGSRELGTVGEIQAFDGQIHVTMEEGAASSGEINLAFEPAHAVSGLGLWYELAALAAPSTRLLEQSPAERAGILPGDEWSASAGPK